MTRPGGDLVEVFDGTDSSLLELVDNLLNQGVVVHGEVILGLAGVDLIYLRLSALLCAADRVLPREPKE
jgi:Gas vesicle protein